MHNYRIKVEFRNKVPSNHGSYISTSFTVSASCYAIALSRVIEECKRQCSEEFHGDCDFKILDRE